MQNLNLSSFVILFALVFSLASCGESTAKMEESTDTLPAEVAEMMAENVLTPEEISEGWELLFDGKNTDKWKGYNKDAFPNQGWQIRDGELIVEHSGTEEEGFGGDIITKESYQDFELQLDFALSDTSNSGIFYLVQEIEDTPIWHSAPEYQLLDDETYKVQYEGLTDKQLTGANYDLHAQTTNYSKPIGEWNTAKIIKKGDHVQHILNDELVIEYNLGDEDWQKRYAASKFNEYSSYASVKSGPVGLQDHGHLCRFKNIKIRKL